MQLELDAIGARLAERAPKAYTGEIRRRAAVAAILRPAGGDSELLLIKRAERAGDPWSGHIALPGGHQHEADADLVATARRETLEEVGIDLNGHVLLGALDERPARAWGRFTGLVIAPFVFGVRGDVTLAPNYEVAEMLWAPLGRMARGEDDVTKELEREGQRLTLPGYRVGEHVVWGLTYGVLQDLIAVLGLR